MEILARQSRVVRARRQNHWSDLDERRLLVYMLVLQAAAEEDIDSGSGRRPPSINNSESQSLKQR
jgi:hypothetical protein